MRSLWDATGECCRCRPRTRRKLSPLVRATMRARCGCVTFLSQLAEVCGRTLRPSQNQPELSRLMAGRADNPTSMEGAWREIHAQGRHWRPSSAPSRSLRHRWRKPTTAVSASGCPAPWAAWLVPTAPGWSITTQYIHLDAVAGGGTALQHNASIVAGLHARVDAGVLLPTYTSRRRAGRPIDDRCGRRARQYRGRHQRDADGAARQHDFRICVDNRVTWADVYYLGELKWNMGVNNFMTYVFGNIPSGTYDSTRLANLSAGYVEVDAGGGYTYLNPKIGHEFSVVAGLSFSGMNTAIQYQNGIDFHADWAASQSSARASTSAWSAMSTSRLPPTAASAPSSAPSRGPRSASAHRSDSFFRPARDIKAI